MTPEELEKLPKPLERTMTALELSVMSEIIQRIREAAQITPVIDWLLIRMDAIGKSRKEIKRLLRDGVGSAGLEIDQIYDQAIQSDYIRNKEIYEAAGQDYVPYGDNQWLQQVAEAVREQTKDTLRPMENITKTTGFNVHMGGRKVFTPLSEYLERSLDKAMLGITTGTRTYSQAVGEVIDEMTASGIRTVDYASGKSDRIEVAARRAVMTGIAQITDKVNEKNAKELGTDYWEVDWHMGARNTGTGYLNHQSWQGRVYSSEEMRTVCGLGEMLGFAGINCYHIRFPFLPGISQRKYTDEWLEEQNRKENEKRLFKGREYDTYGALQYQRRLERTIRKQKQDIKLLVAAKADPDDITAAKGRLRLTDKTYVEFSKEMGLRQQRERLKIGSSGVADEDINRRQSYELRKEDTEAVKQTGGKRYTPYDEDDPKDVSAAKAYRKISRDNSDVKKIAQNTNFTEKEVQQIKRHIFYNKHRKYDGYGMLSPDYDMAVAWKRLCDGKTEERDILLLHHELLESTLEKEYNLTIAEAHKRAKKQFDWEKALVEAVGEDGERFGIL